MKPSLLLQLTEFLLDEMIRLLIRRITNSFSTGIVGGGGLNVDGGDG